MKKEHKRKAKKCLWSCILFWLIDFIFIYLSIGNARNWTFADIADSITIVFGFVFIIGTLVFCIKVFGGLIGIIGGAVLAIAITELDIFVKLTDGYNLFYIALGITGVVVLKGVFHLVCGALARTENTELG